MIMPLISLSIMPLSLSLLPSLLPPFRFLFRYYFDIYYMPAFTFIDAYLLLPRYAMLLISLRYRVAA